MADDPYSYMNFFPQSVQGSGPTPGLYDMLGGMGGLGGTQVGTPEEQQRRRRQQQLAMGQQGMKMLQPPAMSAVDTSMPQQQRAAPTSARTVPTTGYDTQGTTRPRLPPMMPVYPFSGYGRR